MSCGTVNSSDAYRAKTIYTSKAHLVDLKGTDRWHVTCVTFHPEPADSWLGFRAWLTGMGIEECCAEERGWAVGRDG